MSLYEKGTRGRDGQERRLNICDELLWEHGVQLHMARNTLLAHVDSPWVDVDDDGAPRAWLIDLSGVNGTVKLRDALQDPRFLDLVRELMKTGDRRYAEPVGPLSFPTFLHNAEVTALFRAANPAIYVKNRVIQSDPGHAYPSSSSPSGVR